MTTFNAYVNNSLKSHFIKILLIRREATCLNRWSTWLSPLVSRFKCSWWAVLQVDFAALGRRDWSCSLVHAIRRARVQQASEPEILALFPVCPGLSLGMICPQNLQNEKVKWGVNMMQNIPTVYHSVIFSFTGCACTLSPGPSVLLVFSRE